MKNTLKKLTRSQRDELLRYTDRIFYAAIHEGFDSKSAGEMAAKAAESKAKEMAQVSQMNPFRQPSESEEDFREMVQRDQEHFKPLEIVDDRRCVLCGELYLNCDCFEAFLKGRISFGPRSIGPTDLDALAIAREYFYEESRRKK